MLALSLFVLGLAFPAPPASAQGCEPEPEPSASVRRVARRHYRLGVQESQAGNWEAARDAFQQAYETAPFAPVLYNLASSLEQTGQLVEASEMFRAFLRRCDAGDNAQLRSDAEALLSEIEGRLSHVTIRVGDFDGERDVVTLDGAPLVSAVVGEELPISPGRHTVRVERDGADPIEESFTLAAGERSAVDVRVGTAAPERVDPGPADPPPPVVSSGGGDATPAWIVFGASLGVAAVGGVLLVVGQLEVDGAYGEPEGTPWVGDVQDRAEGGNLLRNVGWAVLGVGLAGATAGLIWALVGGGDDGASASVRIGPGSMTLFGEF